MSLRIALVGNAMSTMVRFRGPLIAALSDLGHDVVAICPAGTLEELDALTKQGARHIVLEKMSRQGLDPRSEIAVLRELTEVFRSISPDRVFSFFLKPAIWGSIAGKRAGVPRCVAMIEGMGYAFSSPPLNTIQRLKQVTAQQAILRLLRYASADIDHLLVLNHDDAALMHSSVGIPTERITTIDGIGVDLHYFQPSPPHLEPVRFTMAARLIREKGVEMFAECAAKVKTFYPQAKFRLLGSVDGAPGALPVEKINHWVTTGRIEWPGHVSDVRPHLQDSSVFVLPTFYREGLPRSTMEAMAMGRPVITSNMPGARGSVTHGVSGLVHPVGDLDSLVSACKFFCEKPESISRMGNAALVEAKRRYALDKQNQLQIEAIVGNQEAQPVHCGAPKDSPNATPKWLELTR